MDEVIKILFEVVIIAGLSILSVLFIASLVYISIRLVYGFKEIIDENKSDKA